MTARRRSQPERTLHSNVYQLLLWLKPDCVWFPVPNGAADLGPKLGAILKRQGKIKAGVSDFVFLWGNGCGVIELKAGNGVLSVDQGHFFADCARLGVNRGVAYALDEVVWLLVSWGVADRTRANQFLQRKMPESPGPRVTGVLRWEGAVLLPSQRKRKS